jgi:hypothetical protein
MGPEDRWQIKDDFSYLIPDWGGQHQLKLGGDFSYIPFKYDNMGSPLGSWTFPRDVPYNAADRSTYPTQYTNTLPTYGDIPTTSFGLYVQDDWEVARGLTLNIGLRYDRQIGSFNEDVDAMLGRIQDGIGRGGSFPLPVPYIDESARGDKNNFGPRIGFAWDPKKNGRTNVHGAYGKFFDNIRTLLNGSEVTWPQGQAIVINNPTFPDPLGGRSRSEFVSTAPPNITVMDNHFINAYAHQANFGVSQQLSRDFAVSLDATSTWRYGDNNGTNVDQNVPDRVTRVRPNPAFARVSTIQSTLDNTYKALLVKLEKRMSQRWQALVSYTLSKAEDNAFTSQYGDAYGFVKRDPYFATADRRHRLVVSGMAQLPFDFLISAIGDFRSSLPFNPTSSTDLNNDTYTTDLPTGVALFSGCRDLNLDAINAFRAARNLAAVTSVTCPSFANVDLRLTKGFVLHKSAAQQHRVEFIAQLFNVTNRKNYAVPTNNIQSTIFGQSTTLQANINAPSRQLELAIRYQF